MEKQLLQDLINQKMTIAEMATVSSKAKTTIRYWLKKHELKTSHTFRKENIDKNICTKCNKVCEENDFYRKSSKEEKNINNRHTMCKKCFNELTMIRQRDIKYQAVEYKGGRCMHCGYDKYIGALEFHHLDPTKKDPDWKLFKTKKFGENHKKELDKCILLCSNCHKEEHFRLVDKE